jgi:hypothetical protein
MTATMQLAAEGCAATFEPADGGRLSSFRVGDHELLVAHGKDVFHSDSFVMAPWVGRLRDARLSYGGAQYRFTANNGRTPCTGWSQIGRGRSPATANSASNSATRGLGRAGWSSAPNLAWGARRFASSCMHGRAYRRRSGGILGSSVAWRERPHLLHSNLTWSRD